jgi:hypothetical protein
LIWVYSAILISRLVLTLKKLGIPKKLEILGKVRIIEKYSHLAPYYRIARYSEAIIRLYKPLSILDKRVVAPLYNIIISNIDLAYIGVSYLVM